MGLDMAACVAAYKPLRSKSLQNEFVPKHLNKSLQLNYEKYDSAKS